MYKLPTIYCSLFTVSVLHLLQIQGAQVSQPLAPICFLVRGVMPKEPVKKKTSSSRAKRTRVLSKKPKAAAPKTEKEEAPSIRSEIEKFVSAIDSLRTSFPFIDGSLTLANSQARIDFREFFKKEYGIENIFSLKQYTVKSEHYTTVVHLDKAVAKTQIARKIIPRSYLVMLVSQFDFFVGDLLRVVFRLKPELLDLSEKSLTYAELKGFRSIEAAGEHLIESQIDQVLRKSHLDQFDWLDKKLGLSLPPDLFDKSTFVEVTQRRHLFVHSNGFVTAEYIRNCKMHGVDLPNGISTTTELDVSEEYYIAAFINIYEVGFKLAHWLWRKILPGQLAAADSNLINSTVMLLIEGRFKLASRLLDFSTTTLKKHKDEDARMRLVINRAQAHKWLQNNDKAMEILNGEDWSATGPDFKLAVAVLRDDFNEAESIMKQLGSKAAVTRLDYGYWPLFREFRKSKQFLEAFEDIFGEPFGEFVLEETEVNLSIKRVKKITAKPKRKTILANANKQAKRNR
jgi:hypothetical protein